VDESPFNPVQNPNGPPSSDSQSQSLDRLNRARYQACDDRKCNVPKSIPLKWMFSVREADIH
jgi:hypothetical protein